MRAPAVFAACMLSVVAFAAIENGCTPRQVAEVKTVLDLSICVQGVVLEHVDENLKDPFVAAAVAEQIAEQCKNKLVKDPEQ